MSEEFQYPKPQKRGKKQPKWYAQKIKALRDHMGITQRQMADELQVRQQTISEWETGIHTPHRSTQKALNQLAEKVEFIYQVHPHDAQEADTASNTAQSTAQKQTGTSAADDSSAAADTDKQD